MDKRIEDYALIGDTQAAALVHRSGAIDWLCLPRFDSDACFAALLGDERHGSWRIEIRGGRPVGRRYRPETLVLETELQSETGSVRLVDFMPPREQRPDVVRIVECTSGSVSVHVAVEPRFEYGSLLPVVIVRDRTFTIMGGPDAITVRANVPLRAEEHGVAADVELRAGERIEMTAIWHDAHLPPPPPIGCDDALGETERFWSEWCSRCTYEGPWRDAVLRSLVTLKALTYSPTGGIVAAPTTSLPEEIGGERNWDYRFCWLRDAAFTLRALLSTGFLEEARAWRNWLVRSVAGDPAALQILYSITGDRRLTELTLDWLPGFRGSRPVRIGNAAEQQLQHDAFGEVLDCLHLSREAGLEPSDTAWTLVLGLMGRIGRVWRVPDHGIWEMRGGPRHFTHSKVMAWVAFDRAVKAVESFGHDGPVEEWRRTRDEIREEILERGVHPTRGVFVQYYGSSRLDASLLVIPLVGFLPANDPRVVRTVQAIRRGLSVDGFIRRYRPSRRVEGLRGSEGMFIPCTLWFAENLMRQGHVREATEAIERVLAVRNDVGLLAEEWDPRAGIQTGNFPQAFSHVALVNAIRGIASLGERAARGDDQGSLSLPLTS